MAAAVDGLYERLLADPSLAPYFGGADVHGGRDGHPAHAGPGVTDAAFDRVVVHLVTTLAWLGLPGETIAAIGATLAPLREQIVTARDGREAA